MLSPACCRLPLFKMHAFGPSVKSEHFDFARMENRMAMLPYPHRHDFFHVVWVKRGSGVHTIDSRRYEVRANTLFFMSPGQVHDFELSDDTVGYNINFSADFFALQRQDNCSLHEIPVYALERPVAAVYLEEHDARELQRVVDGIAEEYEAERPGYQEVLRCYLNIFLAKASRMAAPADQGDATLRSVFLARRFKGLLETHFMGVHDVAEYARMLRVTERALNEAARRVNSVTAKQMVRERVLLEAKRLLLHSGLNVAEIAAQLSFEDPAYFSRCFKKHTGRSPLDYRQSLAKLQA